MQYLKPKKKYLKNTKTGKRSKVRNLLTGFLILILALAGAGFAKALTNKSSTSVFSKVVGGTSTLKQDEGRTNIIILGLDRRGKQSTESSLLTDTIIVGSIDKLGAKADMVSIPRDLWVPYANSNYHGKINAIYSWGGVEALKKTVENITGVPIHYYIVIGFEGFVKAVDTIGGITIDAEQGFDDYKYPIEGKENIYPEEDRYMHIHFDSGVQILNGEKALQFARSRHALGDEGTDFARSSRQQKIILAFFKKVSSHETIFNLSKIKTLYSIFNQYIETNISLEEALAFYNLSQKLDLSQIKSQVLNGNLFYNPPDSKPYSGAWVLIPKAGDFSKVQEFISNTFFGSASQ